MATSDSAVAGRRRRNLKLTPAYRLYGLGAILLFALLVASRKFGGQGEAFAVIPLSVAGIAYLLAVREFFRTPQFPKHVILVCLAMAALWHVAFLTIPTGSDDDVRRYVWDGRMQRLGYDPYLAVPDAPAFASLHTAETRGMNHANLPTPYPPGAELFFRAVTAVHESAFALRLAFVLCDVGTVVVLLDVLRRTGKGAHWILAFAWNPLLATEVAGSGHVDILGALLLVISFAALLRRWRALAAVALALAVAVKFLPIVLVPLYWRRVRIRDAALGAIVFAVLCVPFFEHGRFPIGSLGTYVQSFRFNDPVFAVLERVASAQVVAGFAVVVGLIVATCFRARLHTLTADAFAWPMAASLLSAPVLYPWYLLWLLPFVRSTSALPLLIWMVSIIPTYLVWHWRAAGRPWILPAWVVLLEYGCVAVTAAIIWLRQHTRQAG